jgi:hypothetical protein
MSESDQPQSRPRPTGDYTEKSIDLNTVFHGAEQ